MPNIETEEQQDKAVAGLKDYYSARNKLAAAQAVVNEKLGVLKSITGNATNDAAKIEEEVVMMLGRIAVHGLPEVRR